ncbi:MAG: efflux RND transporter periplasmic adaptor subunit [Candidatus Binataceae bacterium]
MNGRRIALASLLIALASGCNAGQSAREESPKAGPVPVMLVSATPAIVAPMKSTLRALGTTVASRHVTIRSPASGRVMGVTIKNGAVIHRGQLIGYIVNREIEAAQAGLAIARKLDPQEAAALAQSVDRYDKGDGIPIVAPDSGVVFRAPVTSGQMVADLDPIAELMDPRSIYVEVSIPINEIRLISPGMPTTVTSGLEPGIEFPTRVGAMIPNFDTGSATAPVRLDFIGSRSISDIGAPVEARIVTAVVTDAIVIPAAALFQDLGECRYHVFVAGADGLAHRVDVTIGIHGGANVQVLSGLKAGDEVITSGGYALSDGLHVRIAGPQS